MVAHPDGNLEVFGVGTDYHAYHAWHDASHPGGLDALVRDGREPQQRHRRGDNANGLAEISRSIPSGVLDHDFEESSGQWFGWPNLGGNSTTVPAVALDPGGRLEAFLGGASSQLFTIWQAAEPTGWSDWASLGGDFSSNFVVGKNANGNLEVFGIRRGPRSVSRRPPGIDERLSEWMSLGGELTKL